MITLNDKQKEAVINTEGPMLILAGAGSGKTRVIVEKISYLINELNVSPDNVLAITFTNKAAKEMRERLESCISGIKYLRVSTFHSLGLSIIKENYRLLMLNGNITLLDSDDSNTVVKKIIKDFNLDSKIYNHKDIKNKISSAKNELMDSTLYEKYCNTPYELNVLKIFRKYEEVLARNNSIDFDDLLVLPVKLFREHDEILNIYQDKYKYIFVDEYQDTNEAQYTMTKLISSKYRNICVVGDNDQAIYSWRGANYKNILNFEKDYKDCTTILLEENYRSTKTILDAANNLIKNNKIRKDKNLWCNNDSGNKILYYKALNEISEANFICSEINKLKDTYNLNQIAVVYRTNAQSRNIEEAFLRNMIPYKIIGSYFFYNRKEIKDLICYLKLVHNKRDDVSLLRVINTPKRGIGEKLIEKLTNISNENNCSIYDAITSGKELGFKMIIEDITNFSKDKSLTELIEYTLDKTGIRKYYQDEHTLEADIKLENLEEFKTITLRYEERVGIVSLADFLEEITLVSDTSEHTETNDVVTLMTMHAAKGLEFDVVFVAGMDENVFPHVNSMNSNTELEEERRLCYVALTRAKKELYLISAKKRILRGSEQLNLPSRFISEIGSEFVENLNEDIEIKTTSSFKNVDDNYYNKDVDYNIGDIIMHAAYGEGVVTKVDKFTITVAFKFEHGVKLLMKNHKSIQKKM